MCYAPTETSHIVGKNAVYVKLHTIQEKLPKGSIVMVMGDLNDNTILLGHVMGE